MIDMKLASLNSIFKKIFYAVFLISIGIILQNRFNMAGKILDWENRTFHEEEYEFFIKILPIGLTSSSKGNIMGVRGQILYSYGGDYRAELLIPREYKVTNKTPQKGIVARDGYYAYNLSNFRKKYRDLCSYDGLMIIPESPDIPKYPLVVAVVLDNDIKYLSDIYAIETRNKKVFLTKLADNSEKKPQENRCADYFS